MKNEDFDRLAMILARHVDNLQRVAYTWSEDIDGMYDAYEARVLVAIEEAYEKCLASKSLTYARISALRKLKARLLAIRDDCYVQIDEYIEEEVKKLVVNESKFNTEWVYLIMALSGQEKRRILPLTQEGMYSIRKYGLYNGNTIKGIYTQLLDSDVSRKLSKVSLALMESSPLPALRAELAKTSAQTRRALLANTVGIANGVSNDVSVLMEQRNQDVISGVMWITALDDKVCASCASHEGTVYYDGDEPPCPLHVNCRCHLVPVTRELKDEIAEAAHKEK